MDKIRSADISPLCGHIRPHRRPNSVDISAAHRRSVRWKGNVRLEIHRILSWRRGGIDSYLWNHYDGVYALLWNHAPEIAYRLLQRILCYDKRFWVVVAFDECSINVRRLLWTWIIRKKEFTVSTSVLFARLQYYWTFRPYHLVWVLRDFDRMAEHYCYDFEFHSPHLLRCRILYLSHQGTLSLSVIGLEIFQINPLILLSNNKK